MHYFSQPLRRADRPIPGATQKIAPPLYRLLSYWSAQRAGNIVPERRDFDPAAVASLLGSFWICERETETGRYRLRLLGEEVHALVGRRVTGAYVEDVFSTHRGEIVKLLVHVMETPAVHYSAGPLYRGEDGAVSGERLALPMAEDGDVRFVYGATIYDLGDRRAAGAALCIEPKPFRLFEPLGRRDVLERFTPRAET
jgi:hypothetical protein